MKSDWTKQLNATRKEDIAYITNMLYDALVETRASVPNSINDLTASTTGLPVALLSVWNGASYPTYGAAVTDYRGPNEPTKANNGNRTISIYDQWFRSASSSSSLSQSTVSLPAQGPISMGTYTFTMPTTGVVAGNTIVFAFTFPVSVAGDATHSMTFNILDQAGSTSRTLTPITPASQSTSGFSNWVYSFTATSLTAGATVNITRSGTSTTIAPLRCIPHVMSIAGLTSSTPSVSAAGTITQSSKHTTPTVSAAAANTIEISYVGDRDGTGPFTTSWAVTGTAISVLSSNSYGAAAPAHSSAIGWNPQLVAAGTALGGREWTALAPDGSENTDSFGSGFTLGYVANPSLEVSAARFAWNSSSSTWTQI